MLAASSEILTATAATLSAGAGAVFDVRSRRIPNLLTGWSCVAGLLLHLWLGGRQDLAIAALSGLLVGAAFLVFYLAGGMGAGDVKLMAAVGCIGAGPVLRPMLLATVFSGAVFALVIALYHRRLGRTVAHALGLVTGGQSRAAAHRPPEVGQDIGQDDGREAGQGEGRDEALGMPFAVPIALGCLFTLCMQIGRG